MNRIVFGAGRLGRLHFLYWNLGITAAMYFLVAVTTPDDVEGIADAIGNRFLGYLPLLWLSCAAATRRAHDRNHSGWFVVLLFVPVANIAAMLYLLLAPSFEMPNRYGEPATGQLTLSADELAQAKAILAAEAGAAERARNEALLTEDGSFDMNGLFRHNPRCRVDPRNRHRRFPRRRLRAETPAQNAIEASQPPQGWPTRLASRLGGAGS